MSDASRGVRELARDAAISTGTEIRGWEPLSAGGVRLHFADATYTDYTASDIRQAAKLAEVK